MSFANVPADLRSAFEWFFMVILAADSGAIPYWKTVVIRAIGPMLSALMIYGVGYQGVTHASQHNADGSHKTVQVQGTTRREDGVLADGLLAEGHLADGDRGENDDLPTGGAPNSQCEPQRPLSPDKIVYTIGRLEYRLGFKEVWLDDVLYDLRSRVLARLCLEYLVEMKAFDPRSARDFAEEIDPYVMEKSGYGPRGKFGNIHIKQYFNDRKSRLSYLRSQLIRRVPGTSSYYLDTGALPGDVAASDQRIA